MQFVYNCIKKKDTYNGCNSSCILLSFFKFTMVGVIGLIHGLPARYIHRKYTVRALFGHCVLRNSAASRGKLGARGLLSIYTEYRPARGRPRAGPRLPPEVVPNRGGPRASFAFTPSFRPASGRPEAGLKAWCKSGLRQN